MWKLLVLAILPCLAAAHQCPVLRICEAPIRQTLFFGSQAALVPEESGVVAIQEVCAKLPIMRTCIATHVQQCQSPIAVKKTEIFKNILEWVCTPEGQLITLKLEKSMCKHDPLFHVKFHSVITGCLASIQKELEIEARTSGRLMANDDICPHIHKLNQCVMMVSGKMCGNELATFVDKIWEISAQASTVNADCAISQQYKRHYLEVAMPFLNRVSVI